MRLMDLPGLLCYSARLTCGFLLSKGCCTYITHFRERDASVRWVILESERGGQIKTKMEGEGSRFTDLIKQFYNRSSHVLLLHYVICMPSPLLLQPHDYMRTINVSCRPASNQLLAYDSHYLHLSRRVIGAQLGLRRQEGLVLVVGVRGEGNVLLDQFCRLLLWLGLTLSNGCGDVTGFVCVRVCVCVWVEEHDGYCMCKGCYSFCRLTDSVRKCDVLSCTSTVITRVCMWWRLCTCMSVYANLHLCVRSDWQVGSWERAERVWIQPWVRAYLMNWLLTMGKPELNGERTVAHLCRASSDQIRFALLKVNLA